MNILLNYFFPISQIESTPQASTGFLKQALVIVKPKGGVTPGTITPCTNMTQVGAITTNTEAQQLFNAGMSRVYILAMAGLDLSTVLVGYESTFFTILISSDFSKEEIETVVETAAIKASVKIQDITYEAVEGGVDGNDISIIYINDAASGDQAIVSVIADAITVDISPMATKASTIETAINAHETASLMVVATVDEGDEDDIQAAFTPAVPLEGGVDEVLGDAGLDVGTFKGVVGVSGTDDVFLKAQGAIANRAAFHTTVANKAKNMFFAFGKLLSNSLSWKNQQYITMPFADDVDELGEANGLFDDKISFVISDTEYGNRLGLFACGGKAIVAPYIKRNLELDMQSKALTYISGNEPGYTKKEAALIEDELEKVIDLYVKDRQWIEAGTVAVKLEQDNFTASGYLNIAQPKALWRIFGEMKETL